MKQPTNGTAPHTNGETKKEGKSPTFQFRGVHLPAEVVYLIAEGKIIGTEVALLAIIESMVEYRGKGCWATNRKLGEWLDVTPLHVSKMISKLKLMELVIVQEVDGTRYLETGWSRCKSEQVCLGGIGGGMPGKHMNNNVSEKSIKKHTCGPASTPEPVCVVSEDSFDESLPDKPTNKVRQVKNQVAALLNKDTEKQKKPLDPDFVNFGDRVRRIISNRKEKVRVGTINRLRLAEEFRQLNKGLGDDKQRISSLIDWYAANVDTIYDPVISDPARFCNGKVFHWLENLMRKKEEPAPTGDGIMRPRNNAMPKNPYKN